MAYGKTKIAGKTYKVVFDTASKREAHEKAKSIRDKGQYKSVRVVKKVWDRRYEMFYVCVR